MKIPCGLFGVTRQAYYKAQKRQEQWKEKNQLLLKKVLRIRQEMPGLGTRKLRGIGKYGYLSYENKTIISAGNCFPFRMPLTKSGIGSKGKMGNKSSKKLH
ncbi:MAG: hypothetical protein AAF944_00795 [Bacteroidota bacterium]